MWLPIIPLLVLILVDYQSTSALVVLVQPHSNCHEGSGINSSIGSDLIAKNEGLEQNFANNSHIAMEDLDSNCTQTLVSALQNITSHTTVRLEPGKYTLEEFVLVCNVTNITLEGDGYKERVSIQCIGGAGLAFLNVSQLSFRNITIDGCGFTGSDIEGTLAALHEFVNVFYEIPRAVRIALFMGHCEDVTIEHVTIMNTRGFGLVAVNVIGTSILQGIVFYNNTNQRACTVTTELDTDNIGGAAAFLYFDYHNKTMFQGRKFDLNVYNCNFILNTDCSRVYYGLISFPGRGDSEILRNIGYRLGGSGAFALVLAQLGYGVKVSTTSTKFHDNSAFVAGGYLIVLFTRVHNTHVKFDDCSFDRSTIVFINDVRFPQNVEVPCYEHDINTTVSIRNSNFMNNGVLYSRPSSGIYQTLQIASNYFSPPSDISQVVKVYIDGCLFTDNQAYVGAAINIYENKRSGLSLGIQVSISDTDFVNNEIVTVNPDATITLSQSAGIVDIRNVNLTLHGNCSFIDNAGTALRAESSLVGVSGNITFIRNTGINGGALHLVSYAYLIMNRNSSVYFIDNEARIGGGAIYVNENGLNSDLVGGYVDCFIHFAYDNFIICDNCSDLNDYDVYIQFSGNLASSLGSMVWGSSLFTCPWAQSLIKKHSSNNSVFEILYEEFPNVFDFDERPDNPTLIRSEASKLLVEYLTNVTYFFPGQVFHINISAMDDFGRTISTVVSAFASSNMPSENRTSLVTPLLNSNTFAILADNGPTTVPIKVLGSGNQNISIVIYSVDVRGSTQQEINFNLYPCGFGFTFDSNQRVCVCDHILESNGISCNTDTQEIIVPDGTWIGPFNSNEDNIVVSNCIFKYCKPGQRSIKIVSPQIEEVNFDVQCNSNMNRVGFLCSGCNEGFSAVLGTRRCRRCSNWYILLFPVFIILGIIAIVAIRYLNINITAGFINGAIFYSNIVSIYGDTLIPDASLTNGPITFVSFLTLNLGFETCLHDKMTTLERVWWQLSFPLYLFILMGITTFLARTKYLKLNRSAGLGTIQAFSTLLILCYVSVLGACIELIGFTSFHSTSGKYYLQWGSDPSLQYFGKEHGTLGFFAYLTALVYIIPLPFFLLFPSFLYRNRYLSKFKPIYDAFWDPFKPKYRFFLGFRLMFRWIPFALAPTVSPRISIFVTSFLLTLLLALQYFLKPFREKSRNTTDTLFILNLVLLFLGSTFFWSEYGSGETDRGLVILISAIYSNTLIILSLFVMFTIIVHHFIVRFVCLRRFIHHYLHKTPLAKIYHLKPDEENTDDSNSTENADRQSVYSEPFTGDNGEETIQFPFPSQIPAYRSSVLREPLLDSGTAAFYSSSSTLPDFFHGVQNNH